MSAPIVTTRHFVTYSGVRLPLNLSSELGAAEVHNRLTFFRAGYDAAGLLLKVEKLVYGEIESFHEYAYYPSGALQQARVISIAEESCTLMQYDESGRLLASELSEYSVEDV